MNRAAIQQEQSAIKCSNQRHLDRRRTREKKPFIFLVYKRGWQPEKRP